jgi:hypothetical protein
MIPRLEVRSPQVENSGLKKELGMSRLQNRVRSVFVLPPSQNLEPQPLPPELNKKILTPLLTYKEFLDTYQKYRSDISKIFSNLGRVEDFKRDISEFCIERESDEDTLFQLGYELLRYIGLLEEDLISDEVSDDETRLDWILGRIQRIRLLQYWIGKENLLILKNNGFDIEWTLEKELSRVLLITTKLFSDTYNQAEDNTFNFYVKENDRGQEMELYSPEPMIEGEKINELDSINNTVMAIVALYLKVLADKSKDYSV